MWIKRNEYNRLKDCERMKSKLEDEVKRLAELISAQVEDCKIGVWCKDCQHFGTDRSLFEDFGIHNSYIMEVDGIVKYCKKHLHELCPEFEPR